VTIVVDRRRLLAICRLSEAYAREGEALIPYIDAEQVKNIMSKDGTARLVACLGGGDETYTFAVWAIDGSSSWGIVLMRRDRLFELEQASRTSVTR
jgi:hypothetical protein